MTSASFGRCSVGTSQSAWLSTSGEYSHGGDYQSGLAFGTPAVLARIVEGTAAEAEVAGPKGI